MTAVFKYSNHPQRVTELSPLGQPQPEFVVFTDDSITYDDGYGSHGMPSMSTRNFLDVQVFYSRADLENWIKNSASKSFDTNRFRVFALKPVEIGLTINVTMS